MHTENLQLMSTMLGEVVAGTWKPTQRAGINKIAREEAGKRVTKQVKFDLSSWVAVSGIITGRYCGFAACAVGHAMLDRRFFEAGLRSAHSLMGDKLLPRLEGKGCSWGGWDDVAEFFGIGGATAQSLFTPSAYPNSHGVSAKQVKARVDALLGGNLDALIEQGG